VGTVRTSHVLLAVDRSSATCGPLPAVRHRRSETTAPPDGAGPRAVV